MRTSEAMQCARVVGFVYLLNVTPSSDMQTLYFAVQVLLQAKSLPTLRQAAFESWPEARLEGRRYALGERLLSQHCPAAALGFMFRLGRAAAACRLLFPSQSAATAEADESSDGPVTIRHVHITFCPEQQLLLE